MIVTIDHSQLLNNVINLRKRYALVDRLSARPFNIFTVLKVERNERYTHSAVIAELLNPIGSHCQGDLFLQLFLNRLDWEEKSKLNLLKTKVKVEHYTGNGFIDIWIDGEDAYLGIENKIHARDQKDQLLGYNDHCLNKNKPYKLIYLTLDGRNSEDIKGEDNFDYLRMSYRDTIIPWLDSCIKETARIPSLRETIYQYQQLLKQLCGVLQNENEAMELTELLKKDLEHFEAASNINGQFAKARYEMSFDFWDNIKEYFSKKYSKNMEVEYSFKESDKYPNIIIGHKGLEHWYACFCIEWLQRDCYYGIYSHSYGGRNENEKKIIDEYEELCLPDYRSSEYFFCYKYYSGTDFSSMATMRQLFSSSEKQNLLQQIVKPVDGLIERYGDRIKEINNEIFFKINPID